MLLWRAQAATLLEEEGQKKITLTYSNCKFALADNGTDLKFGSAKDMLPEAEQGVKEALPGVWRLALFTFFTSAVVPRGRPVPPSRSPLSLLGLLGDHNSNRPSLRPLGVSSCASSRRGRRYAPTPTRCSDVPVPDSGSVLCRVGKATRFAD